MNILEVRRRLLEGGVKKRTAAGNSIVVRSLARMYPGLNIYGRSKQDGTPSPENPVPIVSAGDEGEINVEVLGGNLADISQVVNVGGSSYVQISDTGFSFTYSEKEDNTRLNRIPCKLKAGKQYICAAELSSNYIQVYLPETEQYFGFGQTFTPNEDVNYIVVFVNSGDPYDTYTVEHFIVNVGDTALSWEPYKTPQTLTLSTPNGLPGIPVSSGGKYTDENGQQWICDEIDLERRKYVQRVKEVQISSDWLVEANDQAEFIETFNSYTQYGAVTDLLTNQSPLCNVLEGGVFNLADIPKCLIGGSYNIYLRVPRNICGNTLTEIKSWVDENPVNVLYILKTPIETDLTPEQITAYQSLHTNYPTTTVMNDEGAGMKLTYKTRKSLEVTT